MSGWGYFFLFLLIVVILAPIGWILYTRFRAQRAGLPPPPLSSYNPFSNHDRSNPSSQIYPATSGAVGWVKGKFGLAKRRFGGGSGGGGVTRTGAYEQTSGSAGGLGGGRATRGLDPDEAWDARVGAEADAYGTGGYYEEQELGLTGSGAGAHTGDGPYEMGSTTMPAYGSEDMRRGRTLGRDDDTAYVGGTQAGLDQRYDEEMHGERSDPFGDGAERSDLRGVSPRPHEEHDNRSLTTKGKDGGDSPTERRSMFRENV